MQKHRGDHFNLNRGTTLFHILNQQNALLQIRLCQKIISSCDNGQEPVCLLEIRSANRSKASSKKFSDYFAPTNSSLDAYNFLIFLFIALS
jgi:hypothetical protein